MQVIDAALRKLLASLPSPPLHRDTVDKLVSVAVTEVEPKTSSENRKTLWEYALRNEVLTLAATEGQALKDPSTRYYDALKLRLDLVLTFTEKDACEQIFPFNILYDLLETQTIVSCSHVFSWIESRADRLTEGMVPQKGKALVLLRTLNDLLRRISKMGSSTLFCGRILTFLSQVFPLGERSGVNLRGEYGPVWDGPGIDKVETEEVAMDTTEKPVAPSGDAMQVDDPKPDAGSPATPRATDKKREEKEEFYKVFWSLQLPFSKPSVFTEPKTFVTFKDSVNRVLSVVKEATAKERALMGSKVSSGPGSLKRRREPEVTVDTSNQGYFVAKYLTSPFLLELEIADGSFRRQFLLQLLILLHHLLTFTKTAKATWSTPRNRSLQLDFTLGGDDEKWVSETIQKTSEELRQTMPNGRAFAETVHVILEREKNWVRWKNELCAPFDKAPWALEVEVEEDGRFVKKRVGLEEATAELRSKWRKEPEQWKYTHGSAALTEIWEMGYRDLSDLQMPFRPGDVQDWVKKIKLEDAKIGMRKKTLTKAAERIAQARAKAAAASAAVSPATAPSTPLQDAASVISSPAPRLASSATAPTPLHPSLPAKPVSGLAPAPTPEPAPKPIIAPTPIPAAPPPPVITPEPILPPDGQIMALEENKQRFAWLALRLARDKHLRHFGNIGTGDVLRLAQEIEAEREKAAQEAANPTAADKEEPMGLSHNNSVIIPESRSDLAGQEVPFEPSAPAEKADTSLSADAKPRDAEGDVNMER